ncbi:unnamed protein product [Rhizophagus irregularis]|nr:unnamed protein product [Rhizophagus irregularis]CAB5323994.1 unnamed protein product [Rhizophagus irregularis]
MGKVHRSYSSKRKALERIKAKRRERKKEIREPLSRHDKNVYISQLEKHIGLQDDNNGTTITTPTTAGRVATTAATHQ